jgi:hypothetical protein
MGEVRGDSSRSRRSTFTPDSTIEVTDGNRARTSPAATFATDDARSAEAIPAISEPYNSLISQTQRSVKSSTLNIHRDARASTTQAPSENTDASGSSVLVSRYNTYTNMRFHCLTLKQSQPFVYHIRAVHFEDIEGRDSYPTLTVYEDSGLHLRHASRYYGTIIHAVVLYSAIQRYLPRQVAAIQSFPASDRILLRIKRKIYRWLENLGRKLVTEFAGAHQVLGSTTNAIGLIDLDFTATESDLRSDDPHFPQRRWTMTCLVVLDLDYDIMIGDRGLNYLKRMRKGKRSLVQSDHKKYYPKHEAVSSKLTFASLETDH